MLQTAVRALAVVGALLALVRAQDPALYRSSSDVVSVYATVTRPDGRRLRDLGAGEFQILDNGVAREVGVFSDDIQPITAAIVLDSSGSMVSRLARSLAAAEAFVNALRPGDRASFGTLTHDLLPLTADKARLVAAIQQASRYTFWDTGSPVFASLNYRMTALAPEPGRRVLLIVTDGLDAGRAYAFMSTLKEFRGMALADATGADVSRRAMKEGFMLYALGFTEGSFERELQRIARESGGGFELLAQGDDITAAFTRIVDDLRDQYLLGFVPLAFDGTVHTITVRCTRPNMSVHARETYLAER